MKVLVTGGSGFIASHLIRSLRKYDLEIEALVRESSDLGSLDGLKVNLLFADLSQPRTLENLPGNWDAVIHTAGLTGKFGVSPESFRAVNISATENLFRLSLEREVKHFIHLSTVGVAGPLDTASKNSMEYYFKSTDANAKRKKPLSLPAGFDSAWLRDEKRPCRPSTAYEKSKYAAEQSLVKLNERNACRLTIARIGFTYGPGDMHRLALFRAIHNGVFIPVGKGDCYFQPIFVADTVKGIFNILDKKPGGTQVFNLCGEQPVQWREFIDAIHAGFGRKPPSIHIPVFLGRCGATLCELAANILPFKPALTNSRITLMNRSYTYSIEKAREVLAFAPETGLVDGIMRTIAWYRERRLL